MRVIASENPPERQTERLRRGFDARQLPHAAIAQPSLQVGEELLLVKGVELEQDRRGGHLDDQHIVPEGEDPRRMQPGWVAHLLPGQTQFFALDRASDDPPREQLRDQISKPTRTLRASVHGLPIGITTYTS